MRAILGIGGLLAILAVVVIIMSVEATHTQEVVKEGNKARDVASQIAGIDTGTGGKAMDSADFDVLTSNRQPTSILVTKVVSGGAYERYFGLQRNDTITAVELQGVRMNVKEMNDPDMAKAQIADAFQRSGAIFVMRGGKELKLPQPHDMAAPAPQAAAPAGSPAPVAAPENSGNRSGSALQRQLDAITQPR